MTKATLKEELRKAIGKVDDKHVLEAVYSMIYSHLHADNIEITPEDKAMLDERLARDKAGLDKSYTWEEVKARVRKKRSPR